MDHTIPTRSILRQSFRPSTFGNIFISAAMEPNAFWMHAYSRSSLASAVTAASREADNRSLFWHGIIKHPNIYDDSQQGTQNRTLCYSRCDDVVFCTLIRSVPESPLRDNSRPIFDNTAVARIWCIFCQIHNNVIESTDE